MRVRRRWLIPIAVIVAVAAVMVYITLVPSMFHREAPLMAKPEAPSDLAQLRGAFHYGLDALRRGAGNDAVRYLSSFNFGHRAVEQYRLYFLANAWQIAGNPGAARVTLMKLWSAAPRMVSWENAGFTLGGLYASIADWQNAADIYRDISAHSDHSPVAGTARWDGLVARFVEGDAAAVYQSARELVVKNPRTPQAVDGIAIVRSFSSLGLTNALRLTPGERLERAVSLLRDGDPQNALNELNALTGDAASADLQLPIQLNRGLALNQLHRYQDSNALLEPLVSGPYRIAIPAIYHAWKNYGALAASINPIVTKSSMVKKRVGNVRVQVKGNKKLVMQPKYAKVRQTQQRVDVAKKQKKESYENFARERLKDLLTLPIADKVRIEVLNALITITESRNEDDYEQSLIADLARIDPNQDAGLQHFWDKAWAAYTCDDLNGAVDLFVFLSTTYRNPNVQRQAEYWRARSIERLGRKKDAEAIYRALASAPYDDVYTL